MVAQHGTDSSAYRTAHEWAARSVALDSLNGDAKYLVASSCDRYVRSLGQPQSYGTQMIKRPGQQWRLADMNTTRVNDAERKRLNVPTLATLRARVDSLTAPERP
jgi:hypothetical protein